MSMTHSSFGSGLLYNDYSKKQTRNAEFNGNHTDFLNNIVSQDAIPKRKVNSLVRERKSASQTTEVVKSKQYLRLLIKLQERFGRIP